MFKPLMSLAVLAAALACNPARADTPVALRAEAREMFRDVIAIKSEAGRGQVPVLAKYLADRFLAAGFPAEDVTIVPVEDTAVLVVRYRGSGRGGRPIALLAHMDVVKAKPEDWQRDPFTLVEENGFFYGRGTVDIKSEVVLISTTLLRLKAEKFVPSRDLIIAFSGDEETGMVSTKVLADPQRGLLRDVEFALNGDGGGGTLDEQTGAPSIYRVQGAEKSYASYTLTVRNPGGHSSQPRADNAIYELADALQKLRAYQFPVQWNDWTLGSLAAAAKVTPGAMGAAMAKFVAEPGNAEAAAVLSTDPANVGRTRTTCVATLLQGGHADNALPQSATATVNCRIFPGTSFESVRDSLQGVVGSQVEVKVVGTPFASGPSPMRKDIMAAVTKAVRAANPGASIVPDQAAYATDGAVFRGAGIPTYGVSSIFIKDSDEYAHGLDERVPVKAFYAGLEHWYVLLTTLTGKR
jgi:acetylornithine deacetylase/succinyl-diaminopimelate desuccinylase-like protein